MARPGTAVGEAKRPLVQKEVLDAPVTQMAMLGEVSAVVVACLRVRRRGSRQGWLMEGSVCSSRHSTSRGLTETICKHKVVQG